LRTGKSSSLVNQRAKWAIFNANCKKLPEGSPLAQDLTKHFQLIASLSNVSALPWTPAAQRASDMLAALRQAAMKAEYQRRQSALEVPLGRGFHRGTGGTPSHPFFLFFSMDFP